MVKPKLKRVEIAQLSDLQSALSLAADTIEIARVKSREVQTSADAQIEDMRVRLQKHLDRKDLRPHVIFKPHHKHVWSVSFNSVTYALGPNPELSFDEDAMNFWWQRGTEVPRPVKNLFFGLMAIVMDYCNVEAADDSPPNTQSEGDTAPVSAPLPETTG